ncbi:hypothetical protein [Streptomyces sp. Wb2n-11]|uniref:hypothetical protein n=1 Tax=Streptomyces sp. Wb2n-11 TaxID=1030533 RepID=UPI000A8F64E4|nr:hypothetical protein [Streptomyces sp. Wb2n-11]
MPSTILRAGHRTHENVRTPVADTPAADRNDRLVAARPEEFEELFSTILTEDSGAVARLHQTLETASGWCRTHGACGSAAELDALAGRLADLGEELHLVREGVGHEIRSHRAATAARTSPAVSARGASAGPPTATSAPLPPATVRSLPCSR